MDTEITTKAIIKRTHNEKVHMCIVIQGSLFKEVQVDMTRRTHTK